MSVNGQHEGFSAVDEVAVERGRSSGLPNSLPSSATPDMAIKSP